MRNVIYAIALVGLLYLAGVIFLDSVPTDLPHALATGWWRHATAELPNRAPGWGAALAYAAALAILTLGAHLFLGWFWRNWRGSPWRPRWTILGTALVLTMFVAGTAAVAVVHQTAWLARSPQPLTKRVVNPIRCASNLRQIGQGILLYANDNEGAIAPDLAELIVSADINPGVLVCPHSTDEPAIGTDAQEIAAAIRRERHHCSYVYLGPTLKRPFDEHVIVAYEPAHHHDEFCHALFGDGRVERVPPDRLEKMLAGQRLHDTRPATMPTTKPGAK
jgi:hypothetical protein